MILQTIHDPISIKLGTVDIRLYSICILIAFIAVYTVFKTEAKRFNVPRDFIFNMAFWIFILGVIGARVWYVLFYDLSYYLKNPIEIVQIWKGGLAIHGGLLVGILTIILYCKKYKFRFVRLLDFIAPALLLGQAIGRWGNFFNGEAFGKLIDPALLKAYLIPDFIIKGMTDAAGNTYVPTFFLESFACFVLFILFIIIRNYRYLKVGTLTALYFMGYGVVRFLIEYQRLDALKIGDVRVAQVISVIFFIIGLTILINNGRKSKLDDLYNDKENVPEIKY
ncbi:MAG: prolipoprotein diacylglyceryl transferase [Bacilli bacterium]|nr:prolipoprotein diacylglyceryl transferase [Bacilli bacterium]